MTEDSAWAASSGGVRCRQVPEVSCNCVFAVMHLAAEKYRSSDARSDGHEQDTVCACKSAVRVLSQCMCVYVIVDRDGDMKTLT